MGEFRRDQIIRVYREAARYYDIWGSLFETRVRRKVAELAEIRDGESFLDVGVGTGQLFVELARANPNGRNTGVDLAEEMVQAARARAEKAGLSDCVLKVGDAYRLEQLGRTVDVLACASVFEFVPREDYAAVAAELARVLKPGGRLIVAGLAPARSLYHFLAGKICAGHPAWMGGFDGSLLAEELRKLHFIDIRSFSLTQLSFPSEVVFGRKAGQGD